jgi:hypothetical protein
VIIKINGKLVGENNMPELDMEFLVTIQPTEFIPPEFVVVEELTTNITESTNSTAEEEEVIDEEPVVEVYTPPFVDVDSFMETFRLNLTAEVDEQA